MSFAVPWTNGSRQYFEVSDVAKGKKNRANNFDKNKNLPSEVVKKERISSEENKSKTSN